MSFLRLLTLVMVFALTGLLCMLMWANWPMHLRHGALEVTIAPKSSMHAIARTVSSSGAPIPAWLFDVVARFGGRASHLEAGTYAIEENMTALELLAKMQRGEVVQIDLVVPEGWTFRQMRAAVAADADLSQSARQLSDAEVLRRIGATELDAEGLFFPDTYRFARGTSDLEIYKRAYLEMQQHLRAGWRTRATDLPFQSPYQALILASIVEKETGRAEDRPLIAAVFINRLKKHMLLQTDPSVIYGLGTKFDGTLHKADLNNDTPYNTYLHEGLPPTPIALPGAAALAAVLNPASSDLLYFVARGDGTSQFSADLQAHHRAVDRYQKGRP